MSAETGKANWNFPRVFWTANIVELFERSAYYAVFISITLYLTKVVGFNDIWAGWISGGFSAGMYFLPAFTGAYADKIGFRKAIILAFSLLSVGYFTLGFLPYRQTVIPALVLLMFGGSFIKSIITGTVAKSTSEESRARGYSIFYGMVNVGSFLGKTFAFPMRLWWGLESINFYSATLTCIALIVVFFFYKATHTEGEKKTIREVWDSFIRVLSNFRLLSLILIIAGFWMIQGQMYATMPKYVLRLVGETASPEWIANVNPFVVVTCVMIITHLLRKRKAITSMTIGMFIMPFSALCMASDGILRSFTGDTVAVGGLLTFHPVTVMMIIGIVFQGLAECFISPRYFEFFSYQAPKGQEGLYLGFSQIHTFFSYILGFGLSGYLLTAYCPDPATLTIGQKATAYAHAHYIWYYFAAIGLASGIALLIYQWIVNRIDRKKVSQEIMSNGS
ncbi:MAG: MFS transporter [bacterium]